MQSAVPILKRVQMFSSDNGIDRRHVEEIVEECKGRRQRDSSLGSS